MDKLEELQNQSLHPDLHPLLLEFHHINGHALRAVWHVYIDQCLDKVILEFDQDCLIAEAEPCDDMMVFHLGSKHGLSRDGWRDVSSSEPWHSLIGQAFGWGWITINQQDALDGILLSFDGIYPQVMLNVIASSIEESIIQKPPQRE